MDLLNYLLEQGCSRESAEELVERKQKNPKLAGCQCKGADGRTIFVRLDSPNVDRVNAMLESGIPPMSNTDREFLQGICNGNQFEKLPEVGDYYKQECLKHGGTIQGKKYISQLAKFPGDPEAWVSGRGDVQKVLEKRGWAAEGAVTVKGKGLTEEPPPPIPIADKIVDRETAVELAGQTVTVKEYKDKREQVKEKLTPRWKKK